MVFLVSGLVYQSTSRLRRALALHEPHRDETLPCHLATDSSDDILPTLTPPPPPPPPPYDSTLLSAHSLSASRNETSGQEKGDLHRHAISQGIKLITIAADEYESGDKQVAVTIYLSGLDKMLTSVPNLSDPETKRLLRYTLSSVEKRLDLLSPDLTHDPRSTLLGRALDSAHPLLPAGLSGHETAGSCRDPMDRFRAFGQTLIHIAVYCAVAIKQSPIPDMVLFIASCLVHQLLWIENHYHVAQRLRGFGFDCVKTILTVDEEYRLHEYLSEALYTVAAAILKSVVAFKETPRYAYSPCPSPTPHPSTSNDRPSPPSPIPSASTSSTLDGEKTKARVNLLSRVPS